MRVFPILVLAGLCSGLLARAELSRLSVNSNHRYLQDASGKPFFLVGDSPQNLPLKLASSELDDYMADCEAKGFNFLWVCLDGQRDINKTTIPPKNRKGVLMMTKDWDISTLNEAYFEIIDAMLTSADRHNLYCALTPLSECQWTQPNINSNKPDQWHRYGLFVGRRYKDRANVIWMIGNDTINTAAQHPLVQGLKEAGATQLMTVNWTTGHTTAGSAWVRRHNYGESWIDLDAWYKNFGITTHGSAPAYWQKIEYERSDPMPSFQCEAAYQQPDPAHASDLACRMQNFYVALGGGCGGQIYGSGWLADKWDYSTYQNNGGRVQAIHFKQLFTRRDWTSLVPDYSHTFITSGYGSLTTNTMDYVGAAINAGTLGMAYCPQSATITANLARFSKSVNARWFDPTDGNFKPITGSPFTNAATQDFTTPGKNSEGDGDWVLVLETQPGE